MRIEKIAIENFGKWQQKNWQLTGNWTFFYGKNEAGKSTLHQFIVMTLFGAGAKKKKASGFQLAPAVAASGSLELSKAGQRVAIWRQFIPKASSRFSREGQVLATDYAAQQQIQTFLAPLTLETFLAVYSISFSQFFTENAPTETDLENLLLAVALTGSTEVAQKSQLWLKQSGKIFKPTGVQPELNQRLSQLQQLKQKIADRERTEKDYQQQVVAIQSHEGAIFVLEEQSEELKKQLALCQKRLASWPLYVRWQELQGALEADTPALALEDQEQLAEIVKQWQFFQQQEQQILSEETRPLSKEVGALAFYIENQGQILTLLNRRLREERKVLEIQHLDDTIERLADEYAATCENFGWQPAALPKVADLSQQRQYQTLLEEEARIEQAWLQLSRQLEQNELERTRIDQEIVPLERSSVQNKSGLRSSLLVGGGLLALTVVSSFFSKFVAAVILLLGGGLWAASWFKGKSQPQRQQAALREKYAEYDQWLAQEQTLLAEKQKLRQQKLVWQKAKEQAASASGYESQSAIESWLKNQGALQYAQRLHDEWQLNLAQKEQLTIEIQTTYAAFDFLAGWLPLQEKSLAERFELLTEFQQQMRKQQQQIQQTASQNSERQTYLLVKEQEARFKQKNHEFLRQFQLNELAEAERLLNEIQQWQSLRQEVGNLAQQLTPLFKSSETYHKAVLEQQQQLLTERLAEVAANLQERQYQLQAANFYADQFSEAGDLQDLYQQQANLETAITELIGKWCQLNLASELLKETLQVLAETRLPQVLQLAGDYLAVLTAERYQAICFTAGNLEIKSQSGEMKALRQLSTATYQQVLFAVRFAFIVVNQNNCQAPIMIDDGWLHFDQERKQAFFKLLEKLSQHLQIIVFSSDQWLLEASELFDYQVINLEEV